jgi:hypothetical protein
MSSPDDGRDLRVPGSVGALVRLGLAEIVNRVATSTPLTTEQAAKHVQYELNVLKEKWANDNKEGK